MPLRLDSLKCPRCGEDMIREKGRGLDYWKCPVCGGEFWDDESKLAVLIENEEDKQKHLQLLEQLRWSIGKRYTFVSPQTTYFVRGSSSKSGRKRKKPPKKTDLWGYET